LMLDVLPDGRRFVPKRRGVIILDDDTSIGSWKSR
jgi:hypothetical protein